MTNTVETYNLVQRLVDESSPFVKEGTKQKGSQVHSNVAQKYVNLCTKNGVTPDLIGYSDIATGYKSKVGNFLEIGFSGIANEYLKDEGSHFIGKKIEAAVLNYRREVNSAVVVSDTEAIEKPQPARISRSEAVDALHADFHVNKDWAEKMLTPTNVKTLPSGKTKQEYHKVSLPDSITIFKPKNGVTLIKIGEAKLSGQLDSKNLPKNIDELMSEGAFDNIENTVVKRAILLTGTSFINGKYPMAGAWINEINRRGISLPVVCNEHAFAWVTGKTISADTYFEKLIVPIEDLTADRMFKQLHS